MATVFAEKDSVFFVGGTGKKAGISNPGGCTKEWYDANFTALTDIIGVWGAALVAIVDGEPEPDNKTMTKTDECGNVEAGMVAYLSGTNVTNGRYRVVDADANTIEFPANTFAVGGGWVDDLVCNVGGAFDTLQRTVDDCDASQSYDVYIYDNKPETLAATIDFDTTGGSVNKNSHMIVEGFSALPGDMNYGEDYYQSPLDCLINGIDSTKCVTLDANGGAYDVIEVTDFDNLVLKNIYFYHTNKVSPNRCVTMTTTPVGVIFINCKFDTTYEVYSGTSYSTTFQRCYFGNDFGNAFIMTNPNCPGGVFDKCVFDVDDLAGLKAPYYTPFIGCLFWKGSVGLRIARLNYLDSCIFYGQTTDCLTLIDATYGTIRGINNIFMPGAADDFIVYTTTNAGSVGLETLRKSCVWTIAGVAVTIHLFLGATPIGRQLADVIEADPQFVDAANGDFRLKPTSPLLNTGMRTIGNTDEDDDGYTTIGAWQRISYLLGMK